MPAGKRVRRARSRKGCYTCKQRHIKCDETLPICNNCIKSNKVCEKDNRFYGTFKNEFFKPVGLKGIRYDNIRILDQSLTVGMYFKGENLHDYTYWIKFHSTEDLVESFHDLEAIENDAIGDLPPATPDRSKSICMTTGSSPLESHYSQNGPFNLRIFMKKMSLLPVPSAEQFLTVFTTPNDYKVESANLLAVDDLNIQDFIKFSNFLEMNKLDENFPNYCLIYFQSLNIVCKLNLFDLFDSNIPINNFIIKKIKILLRVPILQQYEILMNGFEIALMDLNSSLKFKRPPIFFRNDLTKLGPEDFIKNGNGSTMSLAEFEDEEESEDFLYKKTLNLNLFDDLNFLLLSIICILIKLNSLLYNRDLKNKNIELNKILKALKEFENNQFLTIYSPKFSTLTNKFIYENLNIQKLHIFYNFVLVFIDLNFISIMNAENINLFHENNTLLNSFWKNFESDNIKRLHHLISDFDFHNDCFMNFLKTYQEYY